MSEHTEQCAVIEWARYNQGRLPELKLLFSVPNGAKLSYSRNKSGQRYSRQAMVLLKEGMLPGVSDLILAVKRGCYGCLSLELKYGDNTTTDAQKEFIQNMNDAGNLAVVCYSAEEAIAVIEAYCKQPPWYPLDAEAVIASVRQQNIDKYGGKHCKRIVPK